MAKLISEKINYDQSITRNENSCHLVHQEDVKRPWNPVVKTPFPDQRTNILLATQPRKKRYTEELHLT